MKKQFFICLIACILTSNLHAQVAQVNPPKNPGITQANLPNPVVFEKLEHNFGTIKEENGDVSYNFEFTNVSDKAIRLTSVQASCGCTTPTWTKESIQPKKTGIVTAIYSTKDRPGVFNKTITVAIEDVPQAVILTIKGDVIARKKGIKDAFPHEKGNLRMSVPSVHFEKILHDAPAKYQTISLYNQGEKDIKLDLDAMRLKVGAPYIVFKNPITNVIKPKDSLKLEVGFDATKQKDWDYMGQWFNIETNDTIDPTKQIYIGGNVVENFGNMTKDAKIPTAKFDRITHNFGQIAIDKQYKTHFTISNTGNAPLIIRQVKATCGCTAGKPTKNTLYPGESTQFDATFSSVGKKPGKQDQEITIITNDPAMPKQVLRLSMEIVGK